ncbi:MAG: hypothetical protein COV67_02760 [Nitrospinae bacterium CG11_big_fil_rev_8_21_14_0_20_56_8]|nr:MAG: hypothetical protein COV67_02760 [Nitrospinae bacterium CG11_big_fil_rev_8_21_14_0_20_56_8]
MTPSLENREGLTWPKLWRFLSLPFRPHALRTYLAVPRFEDIPIDRLKADGVKGILIDADGTLAPHKATRFPQPVVDHVERMVRSGLKVALFTNAEDNRFLQFEGVAVVRQVEAKPDRRGFERAMRTYLGMDTPDRVCMAGDNYITDGGAIEVGMKFIHVDPLPGPENAILHLTRSWAYWLARFYHPAPFSETAKGDSLID